MRILSKSNFISKTSKILHKFKNLKLLFTEKKMFSLLKEKVGLNNKEKGLLRFKSTSLFILFCSKDFSMLTFLNMLVLYKYS